jgi:hypothetical protein
MAILQRDARHRSDQINGLASRIGGHRPGTQEAGIYARNRVSHAGKDRPAGRRWSDHGDGRSPPAQPDTMVGISNQGIFRAGFT